MISNSFPSMIPFWIRIKGIPLHYWQDDMVCRVGKEVGILMNHELTKTTARVQVSVDGLKPLIKELIIEFDSGEETSITLEYERLEYHCTHCYSLSHARRDCPQRLEEDSACPPRFQSKGRQTREPIWGESEHEADSSTPTTTQQEI